MGPANPRVFDSSCWVGVSGRCWEIRSCFLVIVWDVWGIKSVSGFVALQNLALVSLGCPPLLFLPPPTPGEVGGHRHNGFFRTTSTDEG